MANAGEHLRAIQNFKGLVGYLEDELDWPLQDYGFDELTFEYQPAELGLKDEDAVKVRAIHQLRPLQHGQPWGIFFVEFEKKKLPIVVLRRILSHLVVKKRASANKAKAAAWDAADLLFISAFGAEDTDQREIAFAHFHQESGDLPTLRVLGWDGGDTPLKLDYVSATLKERLRWPDDPANHKAWREQWSHAFRHRLGHVIRTAEGLADTLAALARGIRDAARTMMAHESEKGPLTKLYKAFQTALIHDLTEESFADTYAQTITYGLLTAAISRTEMSEGRHGTALIAENVADMVPITNPFLKEMLQAFLKVGGRKGGIDFDELGIQDVVELLRGEETDLPEILRDFGNRTRGEDPVVHFYEHFLSAYNKKLKIQRGVFYTPQPVVSYIVRSVHELLQTEFGLEDGLASTITWGEMLRKHPGLELPKIHMARPGKPVGEDVDLSPVEFFVMILDPATGTATFLVEVIHVIHRTLMAKWKKQGLTDAQQLATWNDYIPKYLLPRLHGYELMMAPYAIAHMKIGLKLYETGYHFASNERVRIYLTNSLEPPQDFSDRLAFDAPALAHEAQAVNAIKRHKRFTVVIGNPPYANYSANLSPQARRIVDKYRNFRGGVIRERNQLQFERNIQDDFVKFLSIAEEFVQAASIGVLSYITNATMLASTSLRGMREHLTQEFNGLFELNLHGGVNEITVGMEDDENVFDIAQSVAVHVYVRSMHSGNRGVNYADLLGRRLAKYSALASQSVATTEWRRIQPDAESCSFMPQDDAGGGTIRRLDSVFVKFGAGIKTNRDAVVIGFNDTTLLEAVREFDRQLLADKRPQHNIHSLLYRPFDVRRIFYHEDAVASRSLPTMKHILAGPNIGLIASSTWTTPERFSINVSRMMVEMKTGTHDRGTTFFPLYRYESLLGGKAEQVHNLTQEFVNEWSVTTQTRLVPTGSGDLERTSGPDDVVSWLYGLFHSPEYRRRYRAALAQRFPIVLLSSNKQLLRALSRLGGELVALHLLESPKLDQPITEFIGGRNPEVEKISWSKNTVWVDKAQTTGFKGVREEVWNFHIGGYQACEKWLKDRKGRTLSKDDITHYHKIVVALSETIRLMKEIDEVIDKHGGWPDAFKSTQNTSNSGTLSK